MAIYFQISGISGNVDDKNVGAVKIAIVKSGDNLQPYLEYTLSNVVISSLSRFCHSTIQKLKKNTRLMMKETECKRLSFQVITSKQRALCNVELRFNRALYTSA